MKKLIAIGIMAAVVGLHPTVVYANGEEEVNMEPVEQITAEEAQELLFK